MANQERRVATMTGTIKKIMRQKGFGFIKPDDGSEDVFFHRGSLAPRGQIEDLNEGDTVQFQSRKGDKGPVAFDLKVR
jgi:CspA family cold shock protein